MLFRSGYIEINFIDYKKEAAAPPTPEPTEGAEGEQGEDAIQLLSNLSGMVDMINDAIQRGYTYRDIAVLVRKNEEESLVANYFLQNTSIEFVSSNSLKIASNEKVKFIISCLRFIFKQKDHLLEEELNFYAEKLLAPNPSRFGRAHV